VAGAPPALLPAYCRRTALTRSAAATGTIAASFVAAREGLLTWTIEYIEKVVGPVYRFSAAMDISKLALQILSGDIDYHLTVKLLGCTPPATEGYGSEQSTIGEGRWGSCGDSVNDWKADVPTAMAVLSVLLADVWCVAGGAPLGPETGFGLTTKARYIVRMLPQCKTEEIFVDLFKHAAEQAKLLRRRDGQAMIDWPALIDGIEKRKLTVLVSEMRAEEAAVRTYGAMASKATGGGGGGGGGAGDKRGKPGQEQKPGEVGSPGTRDAKRAAREADFKARSKEKKEAEAATKQATPTKVAASVSFAAPASGGGAANAGQWKPDFAAGSITMFIDKLNKQGAVETFDYLCREAYPGLPTLDMPCAFAAFGKCAAATARPCRSCARQNSMATPTVVPAGAVARIKAACVACVASRIQ
jgi:hypothetical protein